MSPLGLGSPGYFAMLWLLPASALLWTATLSATMADDVPLDLDPIAREEIAPFFGTWCAQCHRGPDPDGSLALNDDFVHGFRAFLPELREVRARLADRDMPPLGEPQPPSSSVKRVVGWIDRVLEDEARKRPIRPGRVTMRRLSRVEYENSVRDLLGVDLDLSEHFPVDDLGYGYDNIGDVLTMSPMLWEKYEQAAERIASSAIVTEDPARPPRRRFEALEMTCSLKRSTRADGFRVLYSNAELSTRLTLPRKGLYRLRSRVYGEQAGPAFPELALMVDGEVLNRRGIESTSRSPEVLEWVQSLDEGERQFALAFTNDYFNKDHPDRSRRDRNLAIQWFEIEGPIDTPPVRAPHERIFAPDPERHRSLGELPSSTRDRAIAVLKPIVTRAWRRPPNGQETERLVSLVEEELAIGRSFEQGVHLALQAVLLSPHFLFKVESSPGRRLSGYELATRLSYFLWSAPPDQTLHELAASDALQVRAILLGQVERMLKDPRASSLSENFAGQWLELRNLDDIEPDRRLYPFFDDELRESMRRETEMFFDAVLRENRSVWELLDADFTFVNERLARHYGMVGVRGHHLRRVRIPDHRRGGLFFQASMLTLTSNPNRTSPVKRGKWILEHILDAPPPPPPPDVPALDEEAVASGEVSLREVLERHRKDPVCASCHQRMDALGLALENYDPVGRWRLRDGAGAVDARGSFPDGSSFLGPRGLKMVMAREKGFVRALAKNLTTYALGRGLTSDDDPALDRLVAELKTPDPTLRDIILGIVQLDAFLERSGGQEKTAQKPTPENP